MSEEFFIGWQGKAPEKTDKFLKALSITCVLVAVGMAAALPALQKTVSQEAVFDYGNVQEFSGIMVEDPVPMLVGNEVVFYLVNPLKHGFDPELAKKHHLHWVTLKGTWIHRGDQEMIEVVPETVASTTGADASAEHSIGAYLELGETTLKGEIVDSK